MNNTLTTDKISSVMSSLEADDDYKDLLNSELSNVYKLFNVLANLEESEENYILFIDVFEGLYNNDFTPSDILSFISNNDYNIDVNGIAAFIENETGSATYEKIAGMWRKLYSCFFPKYGRFLYTILETYNDDAGILFYNGNDIDTSILNDKGYLLKASINYYDDDTKYFRNIIESQKNYFNIIKNFGVMDKTNISNNYIKDILAESEEYKATLEKMPVPIFLNKKISKLNYSDNNVYDKYFIYILRQNFMD